MTFSAILSVLIWRPLVFFGWKSEIGRFESESEKNFCELVGEESEVLEGGRWTVVARRACRGSGWWREMGKGFASNENIHLFPSDWFSWQHRAQVTRSEQIVKPVCRQPMSLSDAMNIFLCLFKINDFGVNWGAFMRNGMQQRVWSPLFYKLCSSTDQPKRQLDECVAPKFANNYPPNLGKRIERLEAVVRANLSLLLNFCNLGIPMIILNYDWRPIFVFVYLRKYLNEMLSK